MLLVLKYSCTLSYHCKSICFNWYGYSDPEKAFFMSLILTQLYPGTLLSSILIKPSGLIKMSSISSHFIDSAI